MTPELERIGKIIVEKGESGCWHRNNYVKEHLYYCGICGRAIMGEIHPDFSRWENFGRLLKVAENNFKYDTSSQFWLFVANLFENDVCNIDQIPLLVATEVAKVLDK